MKTSPSAASAGLVRALGPLMAIAIVVGTVIGSGVFKKPQEVAFNVPYFGLAALAWILGGVLALLGSLALAEVAVLYPRAGGNYVYLREAYGRLAGFLWGWVDFWIIRGASLAALATVFAESLHDVLKNDAFQQALGMELPYLGYWELKWLTVAVIMGLAVVNVRGVRWGGGLQLFITIVKVGSLLGIMVLPFVAASLVGAQAATPQVERLDPWWPASLGEFSLGKFVTALLGVLWAYHGWMNIAPVAEEVHTPQRNIPFALIGGTLIIIALYLGVNLAYYLIVPRLEMAALKDTTVATHFSLLLLGPIGAAVASAAVMCSVFGALNGNLLVGPRLLYAMGEDRLAPKFLSAVHPRYHTPAWAILIMAAWASILVVGGALLIRIPLPVLTLGSLSLDMNVPKGETLFGVLTNFAMFGAVTFETSAVASIFVFRWRQPDAERAYRCVGYPLVPALYVAIMALVLANMFTYQQVQALVGIAFIASGALIYRLAARPAEIASAPAESAEPDAEASEEPM
ncbi:MAG: APC family permease [Gemmataceae bacterium]